MKRTIAGLVFLALAACGGGGGGGGGMPGPMVTGNGLAPSSGPGDTQDYFPFGAGNQWSYFETSTDPSAPATSLVNAFVNGTKSVAGVTATVLTQQESPGGTAGDSYYYLSPGGLSYVGNNDATDTLTPQIVPYAQMLFPVQNGTESSVTATLLPYGKDNAGNAITVSLTQQIVNTGIEAISVPAGEFTNAMKQVTTLSGTADDKALSQSFNIAGTVTDWLVPGIGLVKETSSATVSTTTITKSESLRGYTIGGVSHGLGAPFATDQLTETGINGLQAALAFNGTNYAVLYPTVSGTAQSLTAAWSVHFLMSNGTSQGAAANLGSIAYTGNPLGSAIASDGTNFLIAVEQDNNFANTGNHPSIVATRYAADGSIVASFVTVAPPGSNSPALAFDGTNYLLVYSSSIMPGSFGQLTGVFISPQTGLTVGNPFAITAAAGYQMEPVLAFDGANYLAVWGQGAYAPQVSGIFAARISPAGTVLDAGGIPIALMSLPTPMSSPPAVAFDGTNYLIAYLDYRPQLDNLHSTIAAARLSTQGALVDGSDSTAGIAVTSAANSLNGSLTAAYVLGDYWLSWVSDPAIGVVGGLFGARVSTAGTVLNSGNTGFQMLPSEPDNFPALGGGASSGLLIWTSENNSGVPTSIQAFNIYPAGP